MKKKNIVILSVAVCVIAVCVFIGTKILTTPLTEQYDVSNLVQLVCNDIDTVCDTEELAAEGGKLLDTMQENDSLLLSFVVDSALQISKAELGNYDHLVIVNPAWISKFDNADNFTPIDFDSIPAGMLKLITDHMKVWSVANSEYPDGVGVYEYTGDGLLAFPANVGNGLSAIQAKNPLVIIIEKPAETMNDTQFLLPMTSSGNIVFSDKALLETELEANAIAPYIARVEGVNLEKTK